jgi:hypothetical protein
MSIFKTLDISVVGKESGKNKLGKKKNENG